jgi:FkbM family methyltransferase
VSRRWGRLLSGVVVALSAAQTPWRRADTRLHAAERLVQRHRVMTGHGPLLFVSEHPQALEYPREFAIREPETLHWIDAFETPCTYWDIGANIGAYALYAGLRPGVAVRAFEPAAANYRALCRNIEANRLGSAVDAYCIAFSDRTELGGLNLTATNPGSVFNAFDSDTDCFGRPIAAVFRQGTLGFSIDMFRVLFGLGAPNYLKIDVDSIEERILAGAAATLRDPELRSVLLEIEEAETPRNARLLALLAEAGFDLAEKSAGNRGGTRNAIFRRASASGGGSA